MSLCRLAFYVGSALHHCFLIIIEAQEAVRASLTRPGAKKALKAALMRPKKELKTSLTEKSLLLNLILNQGMGLWF